MSENKIVHQTNMVSLPTLKMELVEIPSPNPKIDYRFEDGLEVFQAGIEMETIVSKLITHLKKNN